MRNGLLMLVLVMGVSALLYTWLGSFTDLDDMVREQVEILRGHPSLLDTPIHGLVYEVETGRLRVVT